MDDLIFKNPALLSLKSSKDNRILKKDPYDIIQNTLKLINET